MKLYITLGILILGSIPFLVALYRYRRKRSLATKGDVVWGTVLEVYKHRGYKGSVYYEAIIEYPVFNAAPVQGRFLFVGKKQISTYYKGRRVEVYYDKVKPKRFIPKDEAGGYGGLIFTGVWFAVIAVLSYFLYDFMTKDGVS